MHTLKTSPDLTELARRMEDARLADEAAHDRRCLRLRARLIEQGLLKEGRMAPNSGRPFMLREQVAEYRRRLIRAGLLTPHVPVPRPICGGIPLPLFH